MQHIKIQSTFLLKNLKNFKKIFKKLVFLKFAYTLFSIKSSHWLFLEEASNS